MAHSNHKCHLPDETTRLLDVPDDDIKDFERVDRKHLWVLPALAIGCFLSAADQTIVISSYGRIGSELGALNKTSWLATACVNLQTTLLDHLQSRT